MFNPTPFLATHLSRRTLMRVLGVTTSVAVTGSTGMLLQACNSFSLTTQKKSSTNLPTNDPSSNNATTFTPDVELKLIASLDEKTILPGAKTVTWSYQGELLKGDASTLVNLPDSYLGPILRLRKGRKVRIHLQNELPEETIIHWHGLVVPPQADGHPSDAVASGKSYVYEFEVKNRAGTYWFHPHPHGTTAKQVNQGLAGLFIVHDNEESSLGLPDGEFDIPLVIQDRTFDTLNQFVYNIEPMTEMGNIGGMGNMGGMGTMNMDAMMGFLGKRILVNGQPNFRLPVATRAYRLRLLNGSNSRIYKLAWSNDTSLTVIATDGGLLEKPVERAYVTLAPGERVELWSDFSTYKLGDELTLRSLEYTGVEASMMIDKASTLPNGAAFDILTVRIDREESETRTLPTQLIPIQGNRAEDALNFASPRLYELTINNMQWLINGKQFEMEAIDDNEKVKFDSLEVWEFINQQGVGAMGNMSSGNMAGMNHGGMNMGDDGMMNDFMAHPMHIHGLQFQVIERQIDPIYAEGWQTVKDGFVDEGWKDTVLVMPGERVKILARFNEYTGRYLVHCHNLEHESMGMMRNFLIEG